LWRSKPDHFLYARKTRMKPLRHLFCGGSARANDFGAGDRVAEAGLWRRGRACPIRFRRGVRAEPEVVSLSPSFRGAKISSLEHFALRFRWPTGRIRALLRERLCDLVRSPVPSRKADYGETPRHAFRFLLCPRRSGPVQPGSMPMTTQAATSIRAGAVSVLVIDSRSSPNGSRRRRAA